MKKALLVPALFALFLAQTAFAQPLLSFKVDVEKAELGPARLEVECVFPAGPDGQTALLLPPDFGAATKLFRSIKNARPLESRTKIAWSADSTRLVVRSPEGLGRVGIRYEIQQDWAGKSYQQATAFRPAAQENWAQSLGNCLFLLPAEGENWTVEIKNGALPDGWTAARSWPDGPFSTPSQRLRESVFLAGADVRLLKTEIEKRPLTVAVRGKWPFSDDEILGELRVIVAQQRFFWQNFDIPRYLVTLSPLRSDEQKAVYRPGEVDVEYCGAGLVGSFAAFSTNNPTTKMEHLRRLFHHELMHDWIGGKIRPGGADFNDLTMGWFSEGFTEYLAHRNMLAVGHLGPEDFLHEVNEEFFQALWQSPVAEEPNEAIRKGFFESDALRELPYKRGFCFAFWLEMGIKKESKGSKNLRDFMLACFDYYTTSDRTVQESFDFFLETATEMSGLPVEKMWRSNILEGRQLEAEDFALPDFLRVEKGEDRVPRFVGNEKMSWETKIQD